MQNEIIKSGDLLTQEGSLNEKGWSRNLILNYNKFNIKAAPIKIKEWDNYLIYNDKYAVLLSIEDYFYVGFVSASLIDFKKKTWHTNTISKIFASSKFHMSGLSNSGDTTFTNNRVGMNFSCSRGKRFLKCEFVNFYESKSLYANITLAEPSQDSIVRVTPFKENPRLFSYSQKINGMTANGIIKYGGSEIKFNHEDSFANLNWNRGAWPSQVKWCQASACCIVNDRKLGFNIAYGYGDEDITENAIFYDGKVQKLGKATIEKPKENILNIWDIYDDNKRLKMKFSPCMNKTMRLSKLVLSVDRTLLFGKFSGTVVLDNSVVIKVNNMLGFIEISTNKW